VDEVDIDFQKTNTTKSQTHYATAFGWLSSLAQNLNIFGKEYDRNGNPIHELPAVKAANQYC
jgi:hypothetical protein